MIFSRYQMKLDDENFDLNSVDAQMKVKRIKPSAVKFSALKYTNGARANGTTLKNLAAILKSTVKITRLEIDCYG